MKLLQFILSILATLCVSGMFYGAITTHSIMKGMSIGITSLLLIGCFSLVFLVYKEMKI